MNLLTPSPPFRVKVSANSLIFDLYRTCFLEIKIHNFGTCLGIIFGKYLFRDFPQVSEALLIWTRAALKRALFVDLRHLFKMLNIFYKDYSRKRDTLRMTSTIGFSSIADSSSISRNSCVISSKLSVTEESSLFKVEPIGRISKFW